MAAAMRSAVLRSLAGVLLIVLPLAVFSYFTAPGLATLGTVGPWVAGGVASLSLMVTGLGGGGGMAALARVLGDFPSDGWLLSPGVFTGPAPLIIMAVALRQDAEAAWCRVR